MNQWIKIHKKEWEGKKIVGILNYSINIFWGMCMVVSMNDYGMMIITTLTSFNYSIISTCMTV